MKAITRDVTAVREHLIKEFGNYDTCHSCVDSYPVPPIGVPFEVLEHLETEPSPLDRNRNTEFGLTVDGYIPPGIYGGLEREVHTGTSTHSLWIKGSEPHGTKRVSVRTANGIVDWRGVRAVK